MPYAPSYLVRGRRASSRCGSDPDDVTAGETYYDGEDGFAHDGERLRSYSRGGS